LYIELAGQFDGSSACQLLNDLKRAAHTYSVITVDTAALHAAEPFGLGVFEKKLGLLKCPETHLGFTGKNAPDFIERMPVRMRA